MKSFSNISTNKTIPIVIVRVELAEIQDSPITNENTKIIFTDNCKI